MGRLKRLPTHMPSLPPRIGQPQPSTEAERSRQRREMQPWRKWYSTAKWQRLRWSILKRDLFTCAKCGCIEADTSQLVADHRRPHRGSEALFWDERNLQCLCKTCHDGAKQAEERAGIW
ncbi:HNH endonuclease [Defluviimonas sp. SAOS-178_SWC]|uniref:HNH endonuclease n=1 Tax=Defluviimonas sp. SAOS-178_SWC TaxID=3121287 RepID=UPI0032218EE8